MKLELAVTLIVLVVMVGLGLWYAMVVLPEIQYYNEHLKTCDCSGLCSYGRYIPPASNDSLVMALSSAP